MVLRCAEQPVAKTIFMSLPPAWHRKSINNVTFMAGDNNIMCQYSTMKVFAGSNDDNNKNNTLTGMTAGDCG